VTSKVDSCFIYHHGHLSRVLIKMADVQLAPLRPVGDFLLESARFQTPNIKDPEKWANRVLNNLLYYQTNYFLTALLVFLLIG